MFKRVDYSGFDGRPDLKQMVESTVPAVERELHMSSDRISLEWTLEPDPVNRIPKVELRVSDDWAGTGRLILPLTSGLQGLDRLVRELHRSMLNRFLEAKVEELKQDYATSSGS